MKFSPQQESPLVFVRIETTAPDSGIWMAADWPERVEGFSGTREEVADACAAEYAADQAKGGAATGAQIRATVFTRGEDALGVETEEDAFTSGTHFVEAAG